MNFTLHINNNFGKDAVFKYQQLTTLLLDYARHLNDCGYSFLSDDFQSLIAQKCVQFCAINFVGTEFEYFFLRSNKIIFFVLNDIVKHPKLESASAKILYHYHSINHKLH